MDVGVEMKVPTDIDYRNDMNYRLNKGTTWANFSAKQTKQFRESSVHDAVHTSDGGMIQ